MKYLMRVFLDNWVPFLWCGWFCSDNPLPSGSFCSKPQAGLLHSLVRFSSVWSLMFETSWAFIIRLKSTCALRRRSTQQHMCWMLMLWMHWRFLDVQWPLMDMSSLLCEHFVQLLNAQEEAQTFREEFAHNWKSCTNRAVAKLCAEKICRRWFWRRLTIQ